MSQYSVTEQTQLPLTAISQLLAQYQTGWDNTFLKDNEGNYVYDNEGNLVLNWPNGTSTPVIQAFILAASYLFQQIETSFWQLLTMRGINTAEGAQIDVLGSLVGLSRNGNTDQVYLSLIRVRIAQLNSRGTTPELINLALLAFPGSTVFIQDSYPAAFIMQIEGGSTLMTMNAIHQLFDVAKAAGVGFSVSWDLGMPQPFGFAGDPGAFGFSGIGDWVDVLNESFQPILNEAGNPIQAFVAGALNPNGGFFTGAF